ncbi:fucolectin-like, partial [Patiria miniata]|uniref:Fucolectin tachylectin-4 pentraxin-1 domain-containing protein n=1 Tax=Patiria miniata TaxID=46514 RepID=A0A913Z712_PATMI
CYRFGFFLAVYLEWSDVTANVCYLGQLPDPSHPGKLRWVMPTNKRRDQCSCTSLLPAGILKAPSGPHRPYYVDRPLFTNDKEKISDLFDCGEEFSIIGKPAEQSSTYRARTAAKAVDGNVDTQTNGNCAHTGGPDAKAEYQPWWRVDLEGEHCITQVSILNRGHCCSERTTHAVVRAGPSTNVTNNPTCGSPVTAEQAAPPGGLIEMACEPPLRARYVSVDIPVVTILNFCEVTVKELPLSKCP